MLEAAGLIRVVRTRKVRAMTEKFYGRTARLFLYQTDDPDNNRTIASNTLRQAAGEVEAGAYTTGFGLVRARLSKADKRRLNQRAQKLLDDFRAADTPGGEPWSMTLGLWTAEGDDADQ